MLRSHNLLPALISVCNRGNNPFFKLQIYRWNQSENRFESVRTSKGYIIAAAHLLAFVVSLLRKQPLPQWQAVQGYLACMFLCLAFNNYFHNKNNGLISGFLNGLLQYEAETTPTATEEQHQHPGIANEQPSSKLVKLILLFCKVLKYSLHGAAVFISFMSILLPTSPFNIFHALVGLGSESEEEMPTKSHYGLARLSLTSPLWTALVGSFHYMLWRTGVVMLEVTTVLDYLMSLYAIFMAVRLHVRQMTSVGFQTRSKDYLRSISFRKLQLLTGVYNHLHRESLQMVMAVGFAVAFTVCTYLGIRASSKGELVVLAFSLIVASNCGLAILVCFGFGAKVYSESRTALATLKSGSGYYRRSLWYRKLIRSFPIQKIQISYGNFFEPMTPLFIEQSCVSHAITLLLLT